MSLPEPEALEQATRRRIYEHVAAHPGQHMRELQRQLAMSGGTLEYHLRVLTREGLLTERRQGRYLRYFAAAQMGGAEKDALGLLRQEVPRRILALLVAQPEQSHGGLLQQFRLAPSTLTFHMQKLTRAGLVVATRHGRETRYRVADPALIARLLTQHRGSFLDDVVDRLADVFLNVGAGLEKEPPPAGEQRGGSEKDET